MKQLARRYVYWTAIDKDIERFVRDCKPCSLTKNSPPKVPLHPWEEPSNNWERIHIDYAGPFRNHYFLVVVDAKSKWIEVGVSTSAPSSISTMEILLNIFTRNGYPDVMVSDNATIFKSDQFIKFCQDCGIFQKFIAPGNPATNGLAERSIQTLKKKLSAMSNESSPIPQRMREILFKYRTTPLKNGKTPAELFLGRQIRSRLDILKPPKLQENNHGHISSRQLSVGGRVQARYYTTNKSLHSDFHKLGTIIRKLGRLHYLVKLDEGYTFKRHINQLLPCSIQITSSPDVQPPPEQNQKPPPDQIDPLPTVQPSTEQIMLHQALFATPHMAEARQPPISSSDHAPLNYTSQRSETPRSNAAQSSIRASTRQRKVPRHLEEYVLD